jgi:hypothetical protein
MRIRIRMAAIMPPLRPERVSVVGSSRPRDDEPEVCAGWAALVCEVEEEAVVRKVEGGNCVGRANGDDVGKGGKLLPLKGGGPSPPSLPPPPPF